MTNQFDATALAARLGITREVWPEWFQYRIQHLPDGSSWWGYICTLPDPASDDPRACAWFYHLWVACGRPSVYYSSASETNICEPPYEFFCEGKTPTAALYAAWRAKEGKPND